MRKEELKAIRKELGLTQSQLADLVGVSSRTIQSWEYGNQKVPKTTEDFLNRQVSKNDTYESGDSSIKMDVSDKNLLSMEEMVEFCLKNKEQYLEIPSIKLLIELYKNEAKAELLEKHIILRNKK